MVVGTVVLMRIAANVSGVWNLDMQWAGRDAHSTGVCTLKQEGETLTGSCADAHSTVTGEVKGQILAWRIDVEQEGQKGQMTFEGKLNDAGTTITGKCAIAGGREGTFTMTRQ
jgi:hypothetical protein